MTEAHLNAQATPTAKPLKVLHVIPSVSAAKGGPSFAIVDMVSSQRERGIDARIATTNDDGARRLNVDLVDWSDLQGVPCLYFDRWSPRLKPLREFAYSGPFNRWLDQHITEFDLVHVHAIFSACSSYAMYCARKNKIPYIVRTIGQLEKWSLAQSKWRKRLFLMAFEQNNITGATAVHATSDSEARQLKLFDPELAVRTIPLGVKDLFSLLDHQEDELWLIRGRAQKSLKARLELTEQTPILLFLARLHPKKGLEKILNSMAEHADLADVHLLVAGNGEPNYERQLQELCQALALSERVHFLGFVSGQDKNELLLGSDRYVLPSASENFGISVLEALNAGLPAVVSNGVALSDVIQEHELGAVVDLTIANELSDAIPSLLQQPSSKKDAMSRAALAYTKQHYSWPAIAAQLESLYRQII